MKVVRIKARYIDQYELEGFLGHIFQGRAEVMWVRGFFECRLPRGLSQDELNAVGTRIHLEHYEEL